MPAVKRKPIEKWTASDIHAFWCREYQKYHEHEYNSYPHKASEINAVKSWMEDYDVYTILLNIKNNISCTNIHHVTNYIVDFSLPKIYYYVETMGGIRQKQLLTELELLDTMWFPVPSDDERRKVITRELEGWVITVE